MRSPREPVNRAERISPTPETLAKLVPDQFKTLFDSGKLDIGHISAAMEIRQVFFAVVGSMFTRAHDYDPHNGGKSVLPDWIADAHATRYLPWAKQWRPSLPALIGAIVDGNPVGDHILRLALNDYAARMGLIRSRHTIMTGAQ